MRLQSFSSSTAPIQTDGAYREAGANGFKSVISHYKTELKVSGTAFLLHNSFAMFRDWRPS